MSGPKYRLSFTAASLRIHDTLRVAKGIREADLDGIEEKIGKGKTATGKRIKRELISRVETLTQNQLEYLCNSNLSEARSMIFVAICKTYEYIYEFVVEVLREKFLRFEYTITDGEYLSFYNRKAELHPELEALSVSSQAKIRSVLFKMLEEAGIIDSTRSKNIQPQFLSNEFQKLIKEDDPLLLRIFFMTDTDINN